MRYKKAKFALASVLLAVLTACANNNANNLNDDSQNPRHVSTGDLKRPINSVSDANKNQDNNIKPLYTANEIQPMSNGYITIEQNSYSTAIPSHQFPHSRQVRSGQIWYYTFEPSVKQSQTGGLKQPGNGPSQKRTQTALPANPSTGQASSAPTGISQIAQQVMELTNNERRKNGLAPLKADSSLSKVAQTKTNDMNQKRYFSHTSPTYGSPFDMMRDFGVTYSAAGENIAMGQTTAGQVVTAWMNSEGHRKNILNPNFTNIGVGYTSSGNYWSQMFIGK